MSPNVLVIACGAIAHEVMALKRANDWGHMKVQCLPADLHNRPERITPAVEAKLDQLADEFDQVFVAYADCGTGGLLDALLEERGIERIPGAHCYEFFAGAQQFADLSDEEPGTLYLTDSSQGILSGYSFAVWASKNIQSSSLCISATTAASCTWSSDPILSVKPPRGLLPSDWV